MSRYVESRQKKMRALGVQLPGLSRKPIRKPDPPGAHGGRRRRRKSDYGRKLMEKQKLRFNYGLTERQLSNLFEEAGRSKTTTGEKFLQLLESRLDNVVFRAGFAPTIPAARQLVTHGHFRLNGHRADIPSLTVKKGDTIQPREKSLKKDAILESLKRPSLPRPDWIAFDENSLIAQAIDLPGSDSVPFLVDIQAVIEYYSR